MEQEEFERSFRINPETRTYPILTKKTMKKEKNWIIIDLEKRRSIRRSFHGMHKVMKFSTREVAQEIAECLFSKDDEFIIVNIIEDLMLGNT